MAFMRAAIEADPELVIMNVPKQIEYARLEHESDNNYRFVEADGIVRGVWITVRNISVYLRCTDHGVVVTMYPKGRETEVLTGALGRFVEAEQV